MKECINCKAMLEDDELFCHECGTKQEIEEVNAPVEEVQESGGKKCIHCGETIEDDSLFCPFCGMQQDVEDVKDEEPQKEVEKEEPQQEPVEPESLQEPEEKVLQQESVEPEPLQEPEEEAPQQEPVEPEQVQTDEQGSVSPPQPESLEQLEKPKQSEQSEKLDAEEQSTYEWEEEKKSKKWLWILLALLIAGAVGWYFLIQDSGNTAYEPQVDTDMIEEVADSVDDDETMDDDMPTNAIEFLEQFYKGKVGDADYLAENVTNNVLIKLKQDYVYDCPTNDCLAVWVFTAYPPGSDLELEEGPIISETFTKDKYRVDFKYAFYHGTQQENEIRTVYLIVSEIDGRYVISNYEVENDGNSDEQDVQSMKAFIEAFYAKMDIMGVIDEAQIDKNVTDKVRKILKEKGNDLLTQDEEHCGEVQSTKISHIGDNYFEVCITYYVERTYYDDYKVKLSVVKDGGSYKIDTIEKGKMK